MAPTTTTARVNSAWNSEELSHLVQAWEEVVEPPRDRLLLSSGERATLHARFTALSGANRRSLSSVTRQHHRLCTSYRLVVETNRKSVRDGTPGWFDLSAAEQHELRRVHNKKEKGMTVLNPELFGKLDRICGGDEELKPQPTGKTQKEAKQSKPSHKKKKPVAVDTEEYTDPVDQPRNAWTPEQWTLFVDAWHEAVDEFIELGNEPDEKVKLPNWLIRQKFVALGGPADTSVGSITAKKRCIIHSYNFICQCVKGLEEMDGSDWFECTFNERFRLQRRLVSPKSSQRVGCEIDRETYRKIGVVLEKEEVLGTTVTGHKRKRSQKIRKASMSSEIVSEVSEPRSPSVPRSEVSDPEDPPIPVHDEPQVDERVVESLLEAQNARFEQLLHDLREERMEERKQNQAMLLEILHQRTPVEDTDQNVSQMESLVGKQQEQLMDLFTQIHKERQQEREDFYGMVRQLCSRQRRQRREESDDAELNRKRLGSVLQF